MGLILPNRVASQQARAVFFNRLGDAQRRAQVRPIPGMRGRETSSGTMMYPVQESQSFEALDLGVFKVIAVENDHIDCNRVYYERLEVIDLNGSTQWFITIEEAVTRVAKPYLLRSSTRLYDDRTFVYQNPSERTATLSDEQYGGAQFKEEVYPGYKPDDFIVAARLKDLTKIQDIEWLDLNVDARVWRVVPQETEVCLNGQTKKCLVFRSTLYETPQ